MAKDDKKNKEEKGKVSTKDHVGTRPPKPPKK